jgi:hypothetical protein
MKRPHPKVALSIASGVIRPRHISPLPEDDLWLSANALDAAYAWRVASTTSDELEQRPALDGHTPFNPDHAPWKKLKELFKNGDEFWIYNTPNKFWQIGMGSCGIVLVRDELPVAFITRAFN